MKKFFTVVTFVFCISAVLCAQDNYIYSNAINDDKFNAFETNVGSYDNALVVIVQTYDIQSNQQTIEDIKVNIIDKNNKKKTMKAAVKTPYMYIITDYKTFKSKYDFATSNERRYIVEENPDTTYNVQVDANLNNGRKIEVFITDKKKVLTKQVGVSFPFAFSADCNTRFENVINDVDESIDNSGLNNIKDYYTGPKIIQPK